MHIQHYHYTGNYITTPLYLWELLRSELLLTYRQDRLTPVSNMAICIPTQLKLSHNTYLSQRCSLSISFCEGVACSTCASGLLTVAAVLSASCFVLGSCSLVWWTVHGADNISMPRTCADDCWMVSTSLFISSSFCLTAARRLQIKSIH